MGMDAYLYIVHNRKEISQDNFWDNCITVKDQEAWENYKFDKPAEVWYGRKNWDLHMQVFGNDYECGEYVEIDMNTLDEMIRAATHYPDYFGGFSTVEQLCFIYQHYTDIKAHGMILVYEADW